jgi:hypothetical protein
MVNYTSNLERLGYISNFNPNSNKKTFSKTHHPLFGIGVLEEIHSASIHTNPTQPPPKTGLRNLQLKSWFTKDKRGFGYCPLV